MATPPEPEPASRQDRALLAGITVIGLVGGPGSGKGTQCALLLEDPALGPVTAHVGIGDMMRREAEAGGEHAAAIRRWHAEGVLGDVGVTMAVLRRTLLEHVRERGTRVFILDGFPRAIDRATLFEETVAAISRLVVLQVSDEVMVARLGKSDRGRADDMSPESIKGRIRTFRQRTQPVIDHFRQRGTAIELDGEREVDEVLQDMKRLVKDALEMQA